MDFLLGMLTSRQRRGLCHAPRGSCQTDVVRPTPGAGRLGAARPSYDVGATSARERLPRGAISDARIAQLAARASSAVSWMTNTFARPVIRKIFSSRSWLH